MNHKGKKTYAVAIIWAILPIVLDLFGLNENMTIREVVEHFIQAGGLAALRAGVAKIR